MPKLEIELPIKRVDRIKDLMIIVITECSGLNGYINFTNMPFMEFLDWFENDIQYNSERTKKLGMDFINIFKK